ncbi:hypothetical protein [uncultured Methylobacterium sp.]|uniref:hypothetical protein n=1 Tax=uncultured Methylobacterium sp. TaxID=157278 RepID=UPI0035C9D92C
MTMPRLGFSTAFACGALLLMMQGFAGAAPVGGAGLFGTNAGNPLVQEARTFCFNRRSGRFLYWGRCRSASRPRVYCRNRYTGRFLYWGSCRR